jgi:hypothetical protein
MKTRHKADSATAAVRAMVNAARRPPDVPPGCRLRAGDLPFWRAVMAARARDEWAEADLVLGAQLARCMADLERESLLLEEEGSLVRNTAGTMVRNRRLALVDQLSRREMALIRTLRMGGRVAGAARDEAATRALERQSRLLRDELEDDGLLAR